jgi:hypothetical protein
MANRTLEQKLVKELGEPRPEPGHHVVVYKEVGEGRVFYQTLPRGQVFRPPLKDRLLGRYFAYAVPSGSSLRFRFTEQLQTSVGNGGDTFILRLMLTYRVGEPATLVDRLSDDPLGSLEEEVKSVLQKYASKLQYEHLMDERFDIEGYFLHSSGGGRDRSGVDNLDRFQALAEEFGLELNRVEITRNFSVATTEAASGLVRRAEAHKLDVAKVQGEHQIQIIRDQGRRQRALLDGVSGQLDSIIRNAESIDEIKDLLTEVSQAPEAISGAFGARPVLPVSPDRKVLESGGTFGSFGEEVQWMLQVVQGLAASSAEKRGLAGRMLHIFAAICMAEGPGDELEHHLAELGHYCRVIDLIDKISNIEEQEYFAQFRDADSVRRRFQEIRAFGDELEGGVS